MGKLITVALVLVLGCKLPPGAGLGKSGASCPAEKPELRQARNLLGLGSGASRAEVIEAHKKLITRVHPIAGAAMCWCMRPMRRAT
jgi:hypothetical protein